jgi:ribose transport system permease protein
MKKENIIKMLGSILKGKQISGIMAALGLLIVIASLSSPYFLTAYNLKAVIRSLAFVSIVAIGQGCLLLLGEIDLSVGSIAGLCGVIGGILMVDVGINPYLSLILCLFLGAILGMLNGLITVHLKLSSLIVTIGTAGIYKGINLVMSKGRAITDIPKEIYFLGQGYLFNIPLPFIIMLIVLVLIVFITKYTPFGRYMYAVGNSKEASWVLGIKVNFIRITTFMITGLLAALAGIIMVARLGSSQPAIGELWVLNSIAAAVIGGVALTGGIGSPAGALIGATIIGVIENIIVLYGVSVYWQTAVSGVIIVGAVALDSISRMGALRKKKI